MSFWNYIGLGAISALIIGRKKHRYTAGHHLTDNSNSHFDQRFDRLSQQIDHLQKRLDQLDPNTEGYEDFIDEIEDMRTDLYDIDEYPDNDDDDEFF